MNIFVGNLSRDITEEDLRAEFAAFGKVDTVSVIKDKFTGEARGFGFVEMPNKAEAQAAIAGLNGKQLKGQALNVNEARPRTDSRTGGGGPKPGGSYVGSEPIKPSVRYTAEGARTLVVSPRSVGKGVKFGSAL